MKTLLAVFRLAEAFSNKTLAWNKFCSATLVFSFLFLRLRLASSTLLKEFSKI